MDAETKTIRCPLWVKIALALSLAANLCIVGLVAGFTLRGGSTADRAPAVGYAIPYVLALPRDLRREVFAVVRRDDSLPDRRARRAAYREMIALLEVTPFDTAAAEAVLVRQGEGVLRVQAASRTAWLQAVASLSDEERAAYTVRLQETLNRKGPSRKGQGDPGKGKN